MAGRDDSEPTRCAGIADGWARCVANHEPVRASDAAGRGPFYCASCHQEVVLRRGPERVVHFAHQRDANVPPATGEGILHRTCKQEIHSQLQAALPEGRWAIERTIPSRAERRVPMLRPDISGRVRGWPVAIEVQASALDIASILQRTRAYARHRIHVLWVVPVPGQLPDDTIRPKQHERYFHSMYLGRVYYWWPGLGATVLPVHFGQATRPVPASEWYRPGTGRMQARSHEAAYRSIKTLVCGPTLRIDCDFRPWQRSAFLPASERQALPACELWMDNLVPWW